MHAMLPLRSLACLFLFFAGKIAKTAASACLLPLAQDHWQQPHRGLSPENLDALFDGGRFGLSTFANIPYVDCFADRPKPHYDIAILGAPFDTVGPGFSS